MTRRQVALITVVVAVAGFGLVAWIGMRGDDSARLAQAWSDIASAHGGNGSPPAGGFGFGGQPQIVVVFDPATNDAAIQAFVEHNAMSCGDRGCMFTSPFAGAAYNYPDHSVALRIENQASEADVRISARAIRGQPGVLLVRVYDRAGVVVVDL